MVQDSLALLLACEEDEEVHFLVLDFCDAFFQVPLNHDKGRWIVFLTMAQGSTNAPLIWGRVAALVSRLTQAMFDSRQLRLQVFVDDPCASIRGNAHTRRRNVATIILLDVKGLTVVWASPNVIPLLRLRVFAGECNHCQKTGRKQSDCRNNEADERQTG